MFQKLSYRQEPWVVQEQMRRLTQLYKNEAKYNETLKVWVLIISLANLILLKIQKFFNILFCIYNI